MTRAVRKSTGFVSDFSSLATSRSSHMVPEWRTSVRLRVAVVDDDPNFLNAFVHLLGSEFEVVATARDGKSALQSILEAKPDVAILDLQLPDTNAIELTRNLTQNSHHVAVVICSVIKDQDVMDAALEAGASAYVWKDRMTSDLIAAVRTAAEHRRFIS